MGYRPVGANGTRTSNQLAIYDHGLISDGENAAYIGERKPAPRQRSANVSA
jgi:hypothetical protein